MTLDPSVFKAYDVRGIVPDELDADGVYRIVRAYVDEFEPRTMAIGRDMRLTSPELCEAAVRGALDAGSDVDDIGLVGTEMLYYAVCEHGYEGGLIVTASHNPKQYNGMKIVRRGGLPLGGDGGIEKVRDRALAGEFKTPEAAGKLGQRDVLQGFAERCLAIVDASAIAPLQVVLDGANGMAGTMMEPILDRLPLDGRALPLRPRRHVPALPAEPAARGEPEVHHRRGQAHAAPISASPGTATPTAASSSTTPASSCPATSSPRSWPSRCSPSTPARRSSTTCAPRAPCRTSSSARAAPRSRAASGHAFIKHRMRKENALFAGEVSGHYYFRDFYGVDTGIVPALVVLELVSRSGKRLSELLAPLHERYHLSGRDQLDRRRTCRSSCRS